MEPVAKALIKISICTTCILIQRLLLLGMWGEKLIMLVFW